MGEFIGACSRAWDGLERARNESRRFAVTLDGEKHLPSFSRRNFMVRNICDECWEGRRWSRKVC
jgi:hypothetical protein